ncbi:hypothetical protein Ciccas_009778 [Cichlidogyrus casuarinus]|uniref:Uncharacterized protein n=1 Tax=Cichlidogyrus casuarinus TaxID=1844966 RepID=A0ABD2PW22_9PLAT
MKLILLVLVFLTNEVYPNTNSIRCSMSGPLENCPGELIASFRQILSSSLYNLEECMNFARELKKKETSFKPDSTADARLLARVQRRIGLAFEKWENEAEILMASYDAKDRIVKSIDPAQVLLMLGENRDQVICKMSVQHQEEFKKLVQKMPTVSNSSSYCPLPKFPYQFLMSCPSIEDVGPTMCILPCMAPQSQPMDNTIVSSPMTLYNDILIEAPEKKDDDDDGDKDDDDDKKKREREREREREERKERREERRQRYDRRRGKG